MKVLFVHIPKNAGSSVSHALSCRKARPEHIENSTFGKRVTFKHRIPDHFPKTAKPLVKDAFKFTFVREPYDRAVSIYSYSTAHRRPFLDFFLEIEEYHSKASDKGRVFSPQYMWFEGISYDFVGRYENIDADVKEVQRLTQAPVVRFPAFNRSERKPTEEYYQDGKALDVIQRMYKKDFELLGYPI